MTRNWRPLSAVARSMRSAWSRSSHIGFCMFTCQP